MSRYHRLPVAQKRTEDLARMREPAVTCPSCGTQTMASDLLKHIAERCPGPSAPSPRSIWVGWRDALSTGVAKQTLSFWARRGDVRYRGDGGQRQYLLRDLALRIAQRRVNRRR